MEGKTKGLAWSRRRVIVVAGGTAGLVLSLGFSRATAQAPLHRWQGTALGAKATILLQHPDDAAAQALIRTCTAEIERLETIFSLYRNESAVSRLNRSGSLDMPPLDLLHLLSASRGFWDATGGAFDPTVQPLWDLYARHFSSPRADSAGPNPKRIAATLDIIGFDKVMFDTKRVAFARPGMALTFNGIAQGYITDRVADLLRDNGMDNVLISLGEIRALGPHPEGRSWKVGLVNPDNPDETNETLEIESQAVATSGGYGTWFDSAGSHHHMFDPASGLSSNLYNAVTVVAPRATTADALSTGLFATPIERVEASLIRFDSTKAIFAQKSGSKRVFDRST